MKERPRIGQALSKLVEKIVDSYYADERTQHIDSTYLPGRAEVVEIVNLLLELLFPGYHGRQRLTRDNVNFHVGEQLVVLSRKLEEQIAYAIRWDTVCETGDESETASSTPTQAPDPDQVAQVVLQFIETIPRLRKTLAEDVQAAYDGDPAAKDLDEVILSYPGVLAMSIYRCAHELHKLGVPLIPRMMTEYAHAITGVDLHPGARIGSSFFIDHATGVVVGETTEIGDRVKLYQGVTLGALSFPKDARGRVIKGYKRHPTIEDDVTLYSGATVLGGKTVIGQGAVIGGNVFLTQSATPYSMVTLAAPDLKIHEGCRRLRTQTTESKPKK